jgi:ER lumen protein retaining receptor
MYAGVFVARYLDLFTSWVSLYNFLMKLFFISSSCFIIYLMRNRYRFVSFHVYISICPSDAFHRPTNDPSIDTFKVEYLLGPSFLASLIFNYRFSVMEILWSFSIFLEAVAILPQLFMLQRTGEAQTIDTHYLAALGAYRALYIPNWIYRSVCFGHLHNS